MPDPTRTLDDLAALSAEPFETGQDQPVTLMDNEGTSVELTIREVQRNPKGAGPKSQREPFSLVLEDSPGRDISGGCFFLHHPGVGTLPPVLITPIMDTNQEAEGHLYQVVFS